MNLLAIVFPLIGVGAICIGVGAMLLPKLSSRMFGVTASGDGLSYVRTTGVRDVFIGLIYLIVFTHHAYELRPYVCFATGIVSLADCIITWRSNARVASSSHFLATVAVVGYGILLFSI